MSQLTEVEHELRVRAKPARPPAALLHAWACHPPHLAASCSHFSPGLFFANPQHVYSEMMRMREREEDMRNMSEAVNTKVAWMSVTSLCVTGVLSLWQVFHLHAYFKKKKIL